MTVENRLHAIGVATVGKLTKPRQRSSLGAFNSGHFTPSCSVGFENLQWRGLLQSPLSCIKSSAPADSAAVDMR